jgi:DNA-binding response OmpR family regulator
VPASLESPARTAPSVLLIEEYDALAAAITSALKKFAPRHRTRMVASLAEADAAAAETQPLLFIVDLDPPQPGAIDFLGRMSADHPDARVLAIVSGLPREFASERYGPNAIQFIEKPFELAEFGAAVQALLGPWTEMGSGDSRGTLRDLNPRDLVPIECVTGATVVLHLESADERTGEIHFVDGQICHAITPGLSGTGALQEALRWNDALGKETQRSTDAPHTIKGSWQNVFLDALRKTKPSEEERKRRAQPPPTAATEPKPAKEVSKTGKKIVVIDDTEMLLIFVEDALANADPSLQIVTAFTGGEGARRAEVMIPDLVLLDYSLPDLRGDQVCERLLQNEATARIPVVMMSGHVPEMMTTAERFRNVVATIAKPFMSDALVTLVQETLAKGPLPPTKETAPAQTAVEEPAVAAPEAKRPRNGNGKKPIKKTVPREAEIKEVTTKPAAVAPPPVPPATAKPQEISPPPVAVQVAERPIMPPPPIQPTHAVRPAEPALFAQSARPQPSAAKVPASNGSTVILGLGIEVISVQFTPRFQIGTIRAKPTARTLSLTQPLPGNAGNSWGPGFELGPAELDARGQLRTMRVVPTRRAADSVHTHNGFEINNVALVNEKACIQFVAGSSAPMTMQLVAHFKVAAVELTDRFEVAQLVLQPEGSRVRITLDPQGRATGGTEFETVGVRLDSSARIIEFILNSAAA